MTDRPRRRLSDSERLAWLRLARSAHVGPRTFQDLLRLYGDAAAALDALPALSRRGGGRDIRIFGRDEAEREMAATARSGVSLVAVDEPDYPPLLREMVVPPPLIGIRGRAEALHRPAVALVGARNASAPGLTMAGLLARFRHRLGARARHRHDRSSRLARHRHHRCPGRRSRSHLSFRE